MAKSIPTLKRLIYRDIFVKKGIGLAYLPLFKPPTFQQALIKCKFIGLFKQRQGRRLVGILFVAKQKKLDKHRGR